MTATSTTIAPAPKSTAQQVIQTCGLVTMSVIICATFLLALYQAYKMQDTNVTGLLIGTLTAAFMTVVNFWVGSSMSSQKKDDMLLSSSPPTTSTTTVHADDNDIPPPPSPKAT